MGNMGVTQDANAIYTAWQLGADWWWQGHYLVRLVHGVTLYDTVTIGRHQGVRLERIDGSRRVRVLCRYVPMDTRMCLVSIAAVASNSNVVEHRFRCTDAIL